MSLLDRLVREPSRRSAPTLAELSTQVHQWPANVARIHHIATIAVVVCVFAGVFLLMRAADVASLACALVFEAIAGAGIVGIAALHLCTAREVRFTREALLVHQTGRDPLVLPFAAYQREWVADTSGSASIRLIVFGRNRGCTILGAPDWMRDAFDEVARIQMEEGWYEPMHDEDTN